MTGSRLLDHFTSSAPYIASAALVGAIVGELVSAPQSLLSIAAVIVGVFASILWIARGLARQSRSTEERGFKSTRELVAYEILGKGTPRGFKALGFLGVLTILFSGGQWLAFAGFMLVVVWGIVASRDPSAG